MENKKLFEHILRESYVEDIERFKKISKDDIESRMDCTILSGPHNDRTGPCYCIDDHDHEIKILHMQDVLEAFVENYDSDVYAVLVMKSTVYDKYLLQFDACKGNVYYETDDGRNVIILSTDLQGARKLVDTSDSIEGAEEYLEDQSHLIAVSSELNKKFGYNFTGIRFNTINISASENTITIPEEIREVNVPILRSLGITRQTEFNKF